MVQSTQNIILSHVKNDGLSPRQICRMTGLPFRIVRKAKMTQENRPLVLPKLSTDMYRR